LSVTQFQYKICRIISKRLQESGERYVAGGVALNLAVNGRRLSRDIDLFHDTTEALESSWLRDCEILRENNLSVEVLRDAPGFKEVMVIKDQERAVVQWSRDSAFRFFPLIKDDLLGLVLHPFDLATNKVLALAGRLEPRDWVDVIACNLKIQLFGYLAWAACGKDPGFNPVSLLAEAKRSGRYSQIELNELSFDGKIPDAAVLGAEWHEMLKQAEALCIALENKPPGTCVLEQDGRLCSRLPDDLKTALSQNQLLFHEGSIRGTYPIIRSLS